MMNYRRDKEALPQSIAGCLAVIQMTLLSSFHPRMIFRAFPSPAAAMVMEFADSFEVINIIFYFFLRCDFLLKRWIVRALLSLDVKVFARAVLRLLRIASESLKLLDFASCQSIVMSLRHPALSRLRSLWEVDNFIAFLFFLKWK